MTNKQKTFGALVGMDSTVPSGPHRDDWIECADGSVRTREDCLFDCRGDAHPDDEAVHESNVEIVTEILTKEDEWIEEYTNGSNGNDDYASGYAYIVDEVSHDWAERISEWLEDTHYNEPTGYDAWVENSELSKSIVKSICENLDGGSEVECEYDRCEYSAYSGDGCSLYSIDIGEYENEIEIANHDELQALHDDGALDDVLDDVNCDVYIHRSKPREKDEATGCYKDVGRETYNPYGRDCACITAMHTPGGQWHYVITNDRMKELVTAAIIELCRKTDTK